MSSISWAGARNILCIRLDAMGDVLMTSPAIRALRESAPGRRITLLTSSSGAAIAGLVPEIDEILVYQSPWMKATGTLTSARTEYQMARTLRKRRFDGAVIFTVYSQSPLPAAILCHLANIPRRLAHCRENPYQLLSDWVPEPEPHAMIRHECRRQLDLVASVGATTGDEHMSLRVSPNANERVQALLTRHGLAGAENWAVIHVGATAASRRYPPEMFAEVRRLLEQQHGWRFVFTGSKEEAPLVDSVRAGHISLAGMLSLEELAALLSLAPLLISNNTGPVHMAAALGTSVVDLYALTNPQHTPWLVPSRVLSHDVPCRNCYKSVCPEGHNHCLRLIAPEQVVAAALDLKASVGSLLEVAR